MNTPRYGFEPERGLSPQTRRERQLQRIGLLQAPPLHSTLKLLPALGRVPLDTMLAQQPVHPYPPRTVFRRRQIGPKAAPGIFDA